MPRTAKRGVRAVVGGAIALFLVGLWTATGDPGREDAVRAEDAAHAWSAEEVARRFPNPDAAVPADDYVGNAECKDCHEDRVKSLGTSFHASLRSEKKSGTRGCETCHGPARAHTDEAGDGPIRHPDKADVKASVGACLACHAEVLTKPVLSHRDWIHGKGGAIRSCTTCHGIHVDKSVPAFDDGIGPFTSRKALDAKLAALSVPAPDAASCSRCHVSFHPEMARSGHASLLREGEQCAACHGNAGLHVASGGDPRKVVRPDRLSQAESDRDCMACHASGDSVARWTCSEHAREGVSCVTCHDPNAPRGKTLRGSEFELCGGCHTDVQAKFRLPNRHRVAEGRVACSDCHDPHGNTGKLRDADLRLRVCGDCHAEKSQPFLHDHGIKRGDGCVACHDPHGSTNRRMLSFASMKALCIQCHPETPHDLGQRRFDNCIACHSEIHGSDLDRNFRR